MPSRYQIEGTDEHGQYRADAHNAPFAVHDPDVGEPVVVQLPTRELAKLAVSLMEAFDHAQIHMLHLADVAGHNPPFTPEDRAFGFLKYLEERFKVR